MDLTQARFNMVEQQIRTWGVFNDRVLAQLFAVKREDFIPEKWRDFAFVDTETPIADGITTLDPKTEARFLQALDIQPGERVLEIGTGCGYLTALAAGLGRHVYSIEIDADLSALAQRNLTQANIHNVTLEVGDGAQGWDKHAPYDVIMLTGSVPVLPEAFTAQLAVNGRLIAIVGDAPAMVATLYTRTESGEIDVKTVFETVVAPLKNTQQPERFHF